MKSKRESRIFFKDVSEDKKSITIHNLLMYTAGFPGAIIELITEQSYEQFLRENLFLTVGMNHTGYVLPDWNEDDIVTGYTRDEKWGKPTELMWSEDGPGWHLKCNGGILSPIDDMYRCGRAILGNNILSTEEKKRKGI